LVNIGVDLEWSQKAISISQQAKERFPNTIVKAAIGYHPSEVCFGKIASSQDVQLSITSLKKLYEKNKQHVVAIGECGIDTHYE